MDTLTLFSPAKVNLFFRVLHRRLDGFHEIASLYQAISLGDTMRVSIAESDSITCDDLEIPCDERNLMAQALRVFREKTGYLFNVHVDLTKKIPVQAGLGGGSSNAATLLFALNALAPSPVAEATLAEWAAAFSSDAPFFFSTGSAYCCGRGEQSTFLPNLATCSFWLAKPAAGLPTPLVYKHCDPKALPQRDPRLFLQRALESKLEMFNDLEHAAFFLEPSLKCVKDSMLALGFSQVSMTGSGTAFICWGNGVAQSSLPGMRFFSVHFIHRKIGQWYEQS